MVVIVTNQRKNTSWCTKGQTSTEGMSFPGTDFGPLERWVILMMMMRKIIMNMRMDQPYIGSAHVHEALSLMTMTDDTHTHTYRDDHMFDMSVFNCKELQSCFTETLSGNCRNPMPSLFIVTDSNR